MKPRYKVYEIYDFYREFLSDCNTLAEVKEIVRKRMDDTDGECTCIYVELNPETGKYKYSESKIVFVLQPKPPSGGLREMAYPLR